MANKPDAENPAMTLRLTIESLWRRVSDPERSAKNSVPMRMFNKTYPAVAVFAFLVGASTEHAKPQQGTPPAQTHAIQVITSMRPGRASTIPRKDGSSPVSSVAFMLVGSHELTSVKVVHASEYATNKNAAALWHLISDSNSVPTKALVYGSPVRGMKPAVPSALPEPLHPDTVYTLLLVAGSGKGQTNFHVRRVVSTGEE
jgi:hypothetical protein